MLLNNVAPDCWLIVDLWWLRPVVRPVPCSSGTSARHFSWERQERSARWEGWSAQQCRGAEICALIRPTPCPFLSGALLPPSSPPVPLLHDRGAIGAAGVRDTCQQDDRVSSESVPWPSRSHVDWQPASADYRHCGSKRNPLWQWQAYDLQDLLILSNQHFIQRLRVCYPSLENTLLDR